MHVSLDGFVCGPDGEQDWMTMTDDSAGEFLVPELQSTVDTILVGRVLYQGFASYWPAVADDPHAPQSLVDFARWMEDTPKIVFSRTLGEVSWKNSRLAGMDPAAEVAALKKQPGGDMVIFGGAGLVAGFTKLNLVDEYRIKLEPIALGRGRPLFADLPDRVRLKLQRSKGFDSGLVALSYEVIRS